MNKEKSLKEAYSKLLEVGFGEGSLEDIPQFIDKNVMGYGTALDEKIMSIQEFRDLIIDQRKQSINFDEFSVTSKPVINRISDNGNTAVIVDEVVLLTRIQGVSNELSVRMSTVFELRDGSWKLIHWHGSKPEHISGGDDPWHVNEWKRKNEELQKLVDEKTSELLNKNKELEIETALEKVRSSALGMKKPEDMLEVCQIISEQLSTLDVKEIRNVQTAIFYEQRGTYMNYEYYTKHDKTIITETVFTNNKVHNEFATKMLKGKGETFITHIKGDDVKDWIAYQKTTNVFIDKYLETASSLNYYWFSLGPVALGISTYHPLTEEEINLFKRFLKVFELAYQRYLDIEKAAAQAKEARIEASLERVRAVAMGMHKSDDLIGICEVSFKEFQRLGFDQIRNAIIHIPNDEQKYFWDYDYSELTGGAITKIEYGSHPIVDEYIEKIRSAEDAYFEVVINADQLQGWKDFRKTSGQTDDPRLDDANALYYYMFSIGIGDIGISTFKPIDESQLKILKRFRNVFDLAYRRYNDIALAEAQTREAKIESALEKVRGRAMAMRSSEDLSATVNVFFMELKNLGFLPRRCGVAIIDEVRRSAYNMITTANNIGDSFEINGNVNLDTHFVLTNMLLNWKAQKDYFLELDAPQMQEYYSILRPQVAVTNFNDARQYGYYLPFKEGMFYVWVDKALQVDELQIFRRFTQVIGLTYRRYLDIEKAEAQAREAQIELALERVRARTMAMQKSEELKEVIQLIYEQLVQLKIQIEHTGFIMDYKTRDDYNSWIADRFGTPSQVTIPYFDCIYYNHFNDAKEKGLDFFAVTLSFEEKNLFYNDLFQLIPGFPEASKKIIWDAPAFAISTVLLENIALYIENFAGVPYSEEENNTLMRFGKVFQQTYTRFLDLQKAEAQARESQIEAALERVRSKAMAMHSSDDLAITVDTFFLELNNLKVTPHRCGMGIIDEQSKIVAIHATTVTHDNEIKKIKGNLKLAGHPVLDCIFDNWKLQKEYHPVLRGSEILDYYKVMNPQVSFPDFAGDEIQYGYYFFFKEGGVFAWTDKELADGDLQIFRRYTSVLSLTYRRYKDLKEAEAQAREAEIELSLERVRSRAMAMHSPNDLSETVNVFFKELKTLGIIPIRCGVGQIDEATRTTSLTTTTSSQQGDSFQVIGKVKQTGHPVLDGIFDHWKLQKEFHPVLEGDDIKAYYDVMNTQIGYPEYPAGVTQYGNNFFFNEGFVFAWTENLLSEEELIIFRRFTSVLSLTYRRYMDLKEAEEQAREAKIEASLEKVRSKTMSMQSSDELADTAAVVFQQLNILGIEPNRIYITIIKDETGFCDFWFTDEDGSKISSGFKANLRENDSFKKMYAGWKEKKKSITIDLRGEELQEYFNHLSSLNVPFKGGSSQQRRIQYIAYFSKGFIGVASPDETKPETLQLLERFAAVFNLTYTRFNDLKQAEVQNKIIQADNERKTKELEDARQLQLAMLPKELPRLSHLDIAVYMKTATEVGGDYYDFNVDADDTLTVLLGDATGHGLMSGMMVSIMKSFFISNRSNLELKQFFENSNNSIKDMHLGRLMMASLGVQITSDKIIATNAGMPSLLYFRNKSKKAGEFVSNNLPLGAMKGIKYSLKEIKYEKGDTLLLMSDGFAELKNKNDEQYGYKRVKEVFRSVAQKSSNEIVEQLKNSAAQWIKGIEPDDDVTFVVIKIK